MDIRGQDREKKIQTQIARFKSDNDWYTGHAGDVVGDQFYVIKEVSKPHLTADSCVVLRIKMHM